MNYNRRGLLSIFLTFVMIVSCLAIPSNGMKAEAASKLKVTYEKSLAVNCTTTIKTNKKSTFQSSNKKIATVSSKGVVKGKKAGKVKITVTAKSNKKQKKTVTITVKNQLVVKAPAKAKATLYVGEKVTIKTNLSSTFKSSKTSVATVSKSGKVTAKKTGKAKITVTAKKYKRLKKTVTITVKEKPEPTTEAVTSEEKTTEKTTSEQTTTEKETTEEIPTEKPTEHTLKNPSKDSNANTVYDCVWFGNYPQSDATGATKEPIKWRVLSVSEDGTDAFLVADKILDFQPYDKDGYEVVWENGTVRSWLNGYNADFNLSAIDYSGSGQNFLSNAFTENEQNAIKITNVINSQNPQNVLDGGNDTQDKIFLLSLTEIFNSEYGFKTENGEWIYDDAYVYDYAKLRKMTAFTAYAYIGEYEYEDWHDKIGSSECWWLRSPDSVPYDAARIWGRGFVDLQGGGNDVHSEYLGICPALHLNLTATDVWSYAGTINCKTEEITNGE